MGQVLEGQRARAEGRVENGRSRAGAGMPGNRERDEY